MSVNSYLGSLASNLVLSQDEKNKITTSIDTLKCELPKKLSLKNEKTAKPIPGGQCQSQIRTLTSF